MSNTFYSGNAGIIFVATNGMIERVGLTIPAGTVLAQSDPMPDDTNLWGAYDIEMIISAYGGQGPAVDCGVVAQFIRGPVTLVGGLLICTAQNTTFRVTKFRSVPVLRGEFFKLILAKDTKADTIQGFLKYFYGSKV